MITNVKQPIFETNPKKVFFTLPLLLLIAAVTVSILYFRPDFPFLNQEGLQKDLPSQTPEPTQVPPSPQPSKKAESNIKESTGSAMIRNGTKIRGLALRFSKKISEQFPNVTIKTGNSDGDNYKQSILVIFNEETKPLAQSLAKEYELEISELPKMESKPQNSDLLIILGTDYDHL